MLAGHRQDQKSRAYQIEEFGATWQGEQTT